MRYFSHRQLFDLLALGLDPDAPSFRVEVAEGGLVVNLSDLGSFLAAGEPSGWNESGGGWVQSYDPGCTHGYDCDRPECVGHIHFVWWEDDEMVGSCDTVEDGDLCDHFEWPSEAECNDLIAALPADADIPPHPDWGRPLVTLAVTRSCPFPCGNPLRDNPRQRYCSTACRVAAHRRKIEGGEV